MDIAESLLKLFNKSLATGEIPSGWKDAIIVPLFKRGDRCDTGNYRPINLTSI
ncbi:hypothetical protein HELRODRAFT_70880 [Helobdella robusta]|uniref:Reverse transcriptase domain-containing protein n=1 Tax=Helobdella robusta TaxID=6412 RepID=T1G0D6_HELRO|nr:hypothetical protein HELRODRAFT_70880 [Helobdella robusta]ESN90433.1 hypothetical protein HELRODRAFT_70880 [Helobdella robusta]